MNKFEKINERIAKMIDRAAEKLQETHCESIVIGAEKIKGEYYCLECMKNLFRDTEARMIKHSTYEDCHSYIYECLCCGNEIEVIRLKPLHERLGWKLCHIIEKIRNRRKKWKKEKEWK